MELAFSQEVWLVNPGSGGEIAFSGCSIRDYVADLRWQEVPLVPPGCNKITFREGEVVGIVDMIGERVCPSSFPVLFLQGAESSADRLIGLRIQGLPRKSKISHQHFVDFDLDSCGIWKYAALSGYVNEDVSVPLIDPRYMLEYRFLSQLNQAH